MRKLLAFLILLSTVSYAATDAPKIVIIVNAANHTSEVTKKQVADIFLKKIRKWPDGTPTLPADLPGSSPTRKAFSDEFLEKDVSSVETYWQQMVFSSRDTPPPIKPFESSIVLYVKDTPGGIGYVSSTIRVTGAEGIKVVTVTGEAGK